MEQSQGSPCNRASECGRKYGRAGTFCSKPVGKVGQVGVVWVDKRVWLFQFPFRSSPRPSASHVKSISSRIWGRADVFILLLTSKNVSTEKVLPKGFPRLNIIFIKFCRNNIINRNSFLLFFNDYNLKIFFSLKCTLFTCILRYCI